MGGVLLVLVDGVDRVSLFFLLRVERRKRRGERFVDEVAVMWDMHPWIRVVVKDGEELKTVGMEELLPYAYTWVWKPKVEVEGSELAEN